MDLHQAQIEAVDACVAAVVERKTVLIKGKAGTGKSTVTKRALEKIDAARRGRAIIATAYTNKALLRMLEIGFPKAGASTTHQLLYDTQIMINVGEMAGDSATVQDAVSLARKGRYDQALDALSSCLVIPETMTIPEDKAASIFLDAIDRGDFTKETRTKLKDRWNRDNIIIVDEVGMLPFDMAVEIMNRYDTVIFMGDHRQLRPITGPDTINVLETSDVVELTHVYRSNSEILKWADLAERDALGNCGVLTRDKFQDFAYKGFVFIVHTNADVFKINAQYRHCLGWSGRPAQGEPMIFLSRCTGIQKERHPLTDERELLDEQIDADGLYDVERIPGDPDNYWRVYKKKFVKNQMVRANGQAFEFDDDIWIGVVDIDEPDDVWYIRTIHFWNLDLSRWNKARTIGELNIYFAYCITCHRSQGSEFDHVCVKVRDKTAERFRGDADQCDIDRPRYNYTGITRAKKSVIVCSNIQAF